MIKFQVYMWKGQPRGYFKEIRGKYKDRLRDYMNVYICDTFEEMYDLSDKLENTKLERNYGARTLSYTKNFYDIESGEYVKTSPCSGHIIFNKEYFYMDSICHESSHAVIGYFARRLKEEKNIFEEFDLLGNLQEAEEESNIMDVVDNEELFCYMLGSISNQIVIGYDKIDKKKDK